MKILKICDLDVGMKQSKKVILTRDEILRFGKLTEDSNPLHSDDVFGAKTQFGQINAQGMLLVSHIIGVVGSSLPGAGWMCIGVDSMFNNPVFPEDKVDVSITVTKIIKSVGVAILEGEIKNEMGDIVCRSQIKVKPLEFAL